MSVILDQLSVLVWIYGCKLMFYFINLTSYKCNKMSCRERNHEKNNKRKKPVQQEKP